MTYFKLELILYCGMQCHGYRDGEACNARKDPALSVLKCAKPVSKNNCESEKDLGTSFNQRLP